MFKFSKLIGTTIKKGIKAISTLAKANVNSAKIDVLKAKNSNLKATNKGFFGRFAKTRKANLSKRLTIKQQRAKNISSLKNKIGKRPSFFGVIKSVRQKAIAKRTTKTTLLKRIAQQDAAIKKLQKANSAILAGRTTAKAAVSIASRRQIAMQRLLLSAKANRGFKVQIDEKLTGASSALFEAPNSSVPTAVASLQERFGAGKVSIEQIERTADNLEKFLENKGVNVNEFLNGQIPLSEINSIIDRVAYETHMKNWQDGFMSNTGPDAVWEAKYGPKDKAWAKIEFEENSRFERAGGNFGAFKQLRQAEKSNEALKRKRTGK